MCLLCTGSFGSVHGLTSLLGYIASEYVSGYGESKVPALCSYHDQKP